jgi:predicted phage tail protein
MAFGDDANLEVLISFEKRNEHVVAEANRLTESLNDAIKENTRATAFNSVSLEFRSLVMAAANAKQEEFNRHVRANTVATAENAVAQQAADAASFNLWGTIKALPGVWAQVAIGIGAAALALWPFTMLVGSAVIALTSFMVAGAGFAAIGALVAGVFGAMGAGVVALGLSQMGGTDPGATLEKANKALATAKENLTNFDRIHTGGGGSGGGTGLLDAQQALKDFDALHAHVSNATQQRNYLDAQRAYSNFNALHAGHQLTLAQQHQQEGLLIRLQRAQDAYNASQAGGLTLAQQQQREDLLLRIERAGGGSGGGGSLTVAQQIEREKLTTKLTEAQAAYNAAVVNGNGPMNTLRENLEAMLVSWGKQAVPLTGTILLWANGAIPGITQLGQSMMTWFGERLPPVLAGISKIIKDLSPDFQAFGQYFGGVMDKIGPMLTPIVEAFARLALQGAKGLLDNLVRLADWFVKELPTLGPIVAQTFGQIGRFIQWVADNWGTLTDFVIKNWDPTVKNVQNALKELQNWWKENGKTVTEFGGNLKDLMQQLSPLLIDLMRLSNFLQGVGLGPAKLLAAINDIVAALEKVWGFVEKLQGSSTKSPPGQLPSPRGTGSGAGGGATHYDNSTNYYQLPVTSNPQSYADAVGRQRGFRGTQTT